MIGTLVVLVFILPLNRNEYQGISLGGKVRSVYRDDNSAILFVPNIIVRLEVQHVKPHPQMFMICYRKALPLP
jgi:hypothetical protein